MKYTCVLDFGAIEIDGIEADNEIEARETAMIAFRPVFDNIDSSIIKTTINEKKTRPLIVTKLKVSDAPKRKHPRRAFFKEQEEKCKRVVRNAEREFGEL